MSDPSTAIRHGGAHVWGRVCVDRRGHCDEEGVSKSSELGSELHVEKRGGGCLVSSLSDGLLLILIPLGVPITLTWLFCCLTAR